MLNIFLTLLPKVQKRLFVKDISNVSQEMILNSVHLYSIEDGQYDLILQNEILFISFSPIIFFGLSSWFECIGGRFIEMTVPKDSQN